MIVFSDAIKNSAKDLRLDPKVQAAIDAYDLDIDILDGEEIYDKSGTAKTDQSPGRLSLLPIHSLLQSLILHMCIQSKLFAP